MSTLGATGGDGPWRARWAEAGAGLVVATAALSQRVFIPLEIGERQPAILELLPLAVIVFAASLVAGRRWRPPAVVLSREFLLIWGPYLALSIVIPVVGVAAGQFPLRGLAAIRMPLTAVSAAIVGAATVSPKDPLHPFAAWRRPLTVTVMAVLLYAVLQQLIVSNLLPRGPWDYLVTWDLEVQRTYGRSLILGRSTGFFTNPNILGVWAGATLLIGLLAVRGRWRYTIVGGALATLILSQSRGPTLACAVALLVVLILAVRRHESPSLRTMLSYAPIVAAVLLGWLVLSAIGAPVAGWLGRFGQGVQVIVGGDDPNLAGRIRFWMSGLALLRTHPFGTFGPPEVVLGTPVDSEWVRTLLQGGALLVIALAVALFGSLALLPRRTVGKHAIWAMSTLLIVAGVTEIPLQYPPAVLYWALIGAALSATWHAARLGPGEPARPVPAQRPPRILMVTTIDRTVHAFLLPLARAVRARGWTVAAMARGISRADATPGTFDEVHDIGWSRHPLAPRNLGALSRVRDVISAGDYDIVHVHTPVAAFVTRLSIGLLAERRPAVVYTAHGFHFHRTAGRARNLVYGGLERLASRWTDELVVVNEEDRAAARDASLARPGHLHLIPGVGFDASAFDPDGVPDAEAARVREEHAIPPDAPLLVSVAELNHNKNPAYLVEAVSRMGSANLHVAFIGDGPLRRTLATMVQARGLESRIHLVGHSRAVAAFLRAADVFALVSSREGLPVSVMEAMAMGVPVIGTDVRGTRDLLAEGRGVTVPRGEPRALAAAIEEVLAHPDRRAEMTARARAYVTTQLATDRVVAAYLALYQQVLARRNSA